MALARRGVAARAAHAAMTRLVEDAAAVVVAVPTVEDCAALERELADCGIEAVRHAPPQRVDVKAIRERTGLSQDEFALRYGFDVSTLRNWEQGRSAPDTASRTLLAVVARRPQAVEEALEAGE